MGVGGAIVLAVVTAVAARLTAATPSAPDLRHILV